MKRLHLSLLLGALALAGACTDSSIIIGGDGGVDASPDGGGVSCGAQTCAVGQECCAACPGDTPTCGDICGLIACPGPVVCGGETCTEEGAACCPTCSPGGGTCSGRTSRRAGGGTQLTHI